MPPQGFWAYQAQQPNLLQIFQASGLTRQDRDRREQQNLQNKMAQEQAQAVQQRFDRSQQAAGRQLAQRGAEHRADQEAQVAKATANRQLMFANQLRGADPARVAQLQQLAQAQGVELPEIAQHDPDMVGPPVPSRISGQLSPDEAADSLLLQAAPALKPEALQTALPQQPDAQKIDSYLSPEATKLVSGLRGEFLRQPEVRKTMSVLVNLRKVLRSEPTGAGDLSLIFGFMKLIDPGSTVREGEFATAEETGGASGKYRALYNKVLHGERLTPDMRARFRSQAKSHFGAQKQMYDIFAKNYRRMAEERGLPAGDVVFGLGYKGGNQARPNVSAAAKTRLQQLFDRFVDVDGMSEADAIAKAKQIIAQERGQ